MIAFEIYRDASVIATPEIDEQTLYSSELMGMDKIDATLTKIK